MNFEHVTKLTLELTELLNTDIPEVGEKQQPDNNARIAKIICDRILDSAKVDFYTYDKGIQGFKKVYI